MMKDDFVSGSAATSEKISTQRFIYNSCTGQHEAVPSYEMFIKGPISLNWIVSANNLPGKAGPVGLALWFLAGINKGFTFHLTGEVEVIAGCERKATYTALRSLSKAGLISVEPKVGARPTVTILN